VRRQRKLAAHSLGAPMVVASVHPPIPKGPFVTAPPVRCVASATTYIAELTPTAGRIGVTDPCSRGS